MDSLVKLQILTLFRKYDYLLNEFKVKNEISNLSLRVFKDNINNIIKSNESLSNILEKEEIENDEFHEQDTELIAEESTDTDENIKSLFRKIVKLTHPDTVKNEFLNTIYLDAIAAFRNNDKLDLIRISILLGLDVEVSEEISYLLQDKIIEIEKRIIFIESSYHMKWHNSPKNEKIEIMYNYLKKQLKLSAV